METYKQRKTIMMKKYLLINRKKFKFAKNSVDFVNWMRKCDFQRWETNNEFMDAYAYRKLIFEKIKLRTENEDLFIKDLQTFNILRVEFEKPLFMFINHIFSSKNMYKN